MLEPVIRARLLEHSAEDLFYRGQQARIPLARVPTLEELFGVDQFRQREAFCEASTETATLTVPAVPYRLFATPPHFGGPVAELGAHTLVFA